MVGVAYAISPSTVVCGGILAALFFWAQRGISGTERRWLLGVLSVSLVLRLAVLLGFFAIGGSRDALPVLIPDEWLIKWRSMLILNMSLGRTLAPTDYYNVYEVYGRTSVMNLFATWQFWFGPAPYGVHLVNMCLWFAASIMLFRAARRAFGVAAAMAGLIALLFVPTMFVWSISALKEPSFFFFTALSIVAGTQLIRGPSLVTRLFAVAGLGVALFLIEPVRSIALYVAGGGVAVGLAGWFVTRRAWLWLAAVVIVLGAGFQFRNNATVGALAIKGYRLAATNHLGNVRTIGTAYRLLDQRFYMDFYQDQIYTMQPEEAARFAFRAVGSFVTQPIPWEAKSRAMVAFIAPQMIWYLLAALGVVGAIAGWRREPAFTWMLIGNVLVGATVVALSNGNIGTLVRFRDSVVTIIVWLSGLGACAVLQWAARRFSGEHLDASAR